MQLNGSNVIFYKRKVYAYFCSINNGNAIFKEFDGAEHNEQKILNFNLKKLPQVLLHLYFLNIFIY